MFTFRTKRGKVTIRCTLQYASQLAYRKDLSGIYTDGPIRVYL